MARSKKARPDLALMPMLPHESIYIGVDVGKFRHVAGFLSRALLQRHQHFEGCPTFAFEQSRDGFRAFVDRIREYTPLEQVTVLYVLVGTYDLLDFRNLNGQAARRGHDLHFPRYQFQHEADRKAFQGALHTLLQQVPLDMDIQDLMNHWYYFYERSIGCVGVLKDWLVRTVASSLRAGMRTLTLARLEHHALSNAQCESMAADANAAEQKLQYTENSREHLWKLLGMSGMPMSEIAPLGHPSGSSSSPPSPAGSRRVGERAPGRDPVGEAQQIGGSTKCSFVGDIDVSPRQMAETGVSRFECPECLAMRALTPQGATVRFPPHDKRKTRTPHREVRWIKRGTTWMLSEKNR